MSSRTDMICEVLSARSGSVDSYGHPIADRNNINSLSLVAYASILRTFHRCSENNNCSRMRSSDSSWIYARYISICRWYHKINEINIVGPTLVLLLISHICHRSCDTHQISIIRRAIILWCDLRAIACATDFWHNRIFI